MGGTIPSLVSASWSLMLRLWMWPSGRRCLSGTRKPGVQFFLPPANHKATKNNASRSMHRGYSCWCPWKWEVKPGAADTKKSWRFLVHSVVPSNSESLSLCTYKGNIVFCVSLWLALATTAWLKIRGHHHCLQLLGWPEWETTTVFPGIWISDPHLTAPFWGNSLLEEL